MPDFNFKAGSFPIADVINAAQRKVQLEQQAKQQDSNNLVQGLGMIGQVGQTLADKRMKVAQALALGKQFDIPDDVARGMDPSQILQVGAIKKGQVDMNMLMNMLHPGFAPNIPPTATPASGTPSPAAPSNGAILASNSTATPVATPSPIAPNALPAPANAPVPIAAPPAKPPMVNGATANMAYKMALANRPEPVMTQSDALNAGQVPKGTKIIDTNKNLASGSGEYDKLENQVINRIVGIRGDKSLARTEEQRDAAIQAYNTIGQIKSENRLPNQLEYYDILGQMWKARTGASPTDQAIRDLDASTLKGDLGKAYQYFSGNAAPRTTANVLDAIQSFAKQSGMQADKLHAGYMQSHLVKPKNMSQEDFSGIVQAHRGQTFSEATGVDGSAQPQGQQNPSWNDSSEQRLQMLLEKKKNGTLKS